MDTKITDIKSNFIELIRNNEILIPIIQRDYAQGRCDSKTIDIREKFLSDLINALELGNKTLNLDFVYGSTIESKFVPLDGQQRLTTLFLLHWYLCPDDEMIKFQQNNDVSKTSKFTYDTRTSSKDFCNKLVFTSLSDILSNLDIIIKKNNEEMKSWSLSKSIKNEPWFMWAWEKDPTIKSMLVMLDDIHDKLQSKTEEERANMWNNLKKGIISFHLLPLKNFNLTDELYVKMNARGKELSSFDIFKSTMEEQMRLSIEDEENNEIIKKRETILEKWRKNVDSNWIDIFWNKLAKPKIELNIDKENFVKSVEQSYLLFLSGMMVFHLFTNDDCLSFDAFKKNDSSDIDISKINRILPIDIKMNDNDDVLAKIREYSVRGDILLLLPFLTRSKFFNMQFFVYVLKVFDSFIYKKNEIKHDGSDLIEGIDFELKKEFDNNLFIAFIKNRTRDTMVQFYALLTFFEYFSAEVVTANDSMMKELNSWMRVIRNLSVNTNTNYYNTYEEVRKSLIEIKKWGENIYGKDSGTILADLASSNQSVSGFDGSQFSEEKEKARLMTKTELKEQWTQVIRIAEEHKYFLGQIRFLLEWSKETENAYNIEKFKNYYIKILSVFNDKGTGLQEDLCKEYLFNNTMMAANEWYLYKNCFMDNSKNRDWSWKNYLRVPENKNFKMLLDECDDTQVSFIDFCKDYIKKNKPDDWRKCFIEYPSIYNELNSKKIDKWNNSINQICLLNKTRWSSIHKELRTYYWFLKYRQEIDKYLDSRDSHPFSAVFYRKDDREFTVKFIQDGHYCVSANFDTGINSMILNQKNNRWEQDELSENTHKVEELLKQINSIPY